MRSVAIQMHADRIGIDHVRISRPRESIREAGQCLRKLLGMRAGHVLELAGEDFIDGGVVPPGEVMQHLLLISRNMRPQLDEPDRLRQDGRLLQ